MKNSYKYLINMLVVFILFSAFSETLNAQGITFNFANPQVTTSAPNTFFEFDVMAIASANSQFYIAQVYINYNTAAFGSNIFGSGNITVTKGELLNDVSVADPGQTPPFDGGTYDISSPGSVADNNSSTVAIQNFWSKFDPDLDKTGYDLTNNLGTTSKVYVHVKIKVQNTSQSSGLTFANVTDFDKQQFYFSSGNTTAQYSPVSLGSGIDAPLPVELSSFTAKTNQNAINLNWQTKTEVNNYGFEVERKVGSRELVVGSWEKIGFVNGHGNSNSPKDYSLTDKYPSGGSKFVYRLKQIDNDGKFEYSKEVEVEIVPNEFDLYQNYPNPFNPVTNIKFALPKTSKVTLLVYNLLGEKVAALFNEDKEAGFYNVQFNASNLSTGVYIYRLTAGDFIQTKKMTLLK